MDIRIKQHIVDPAKQDEKSLLCPHCHHRVIVKFPYGATPLQRHNATKAAIDEHRKLCTGADVVEGRVYTIEYPR